MRWKWTLVLAVFGFVVAGASWWMWGAEDVSSWPPEDSGAGVVDKAWAFYQTRPRYERPAPPSAIPAGLPDVRSSTCGACHREIYDEWLLSTHRRAWLDDAQFQEELKKSRGDGSGRGDVSWMCIQCHTPSIRQLERLVVGLEEGRIDRPVYVDNPTFDPMFQKDAISCAACHVRDGVVYGPYGDTRAPHPTARGEFLRTEEVCVRCHQAEARYPAQNLGCFFATGREWEASSASRGGKTCQSCHMPEVVRKVAPAFDVPERVTRRHWFGGSLIPKKPEFAEALKPLEQVYGDGVGFSIELRDRVAPSREPLNYPEGEAPQEIRCEDDCVYVVLTVTNDRAGHYVPTGDPERHLEVVLEAEGASGVVARSADLMGSRYVWWPSVKLVRDTRIPPGQFREVVLSVPRDALPVRVRARADKARMYKGAFEHHHLEGKYVRARRFWEGEWSLQKDGSRVGLKAEEKPR